jgi:hypothetical protein
MRHEHIHAHIEPDDLLSFAVARSQRNANATVIDAQPLQICNDNPVISKHDSPVMSASTHRSGKRKRSKKK